MEVEKSGKVVSITLTKTRDSNYRLFTFFFPLGFFRRSYLTADNEDRPSDCFRHRKTDFPVASSKNASEVLHTSMTHHSRKVVEGERDCSARALRPYRS